MHELPITAAVGAWVRVQPLASIATFFVHAFIQDLNEPRLEQKKQHPPCSETSHRWDETLCSPQVTFVEVSGNFLPDNVLLLEEFVAANSRGIESTYEWVSPDEASEVSGVW